jgi:FkbM family methyltransferase
MTDPFIFDIGMHKGEDTEYYLRKGYRVAAFEANPGLVRICRERFKQQVTSGRLVIFEGLLRAEGSLDTAPFWVNQVHSDWGTASPGWRDRNRRAFHADSDLIQVPVVNLKAVIADLGVPHYAKIDIEGMDHEILRAFGAFEDRPKYVSVESDNSSFEALHAEIELLHSLGYRRFAAVQQRTIPGTEIRTLTVEALPMRHTFERHASGPFGPDVHGWTDRSGILDNYRRIFRDYERWGDRSWLQRHFGRAPIAALQLLAGRPLPGWYDTHARLD